MREIALRWRARRSVKLADVSYYPRRDKNERTNNSEKDVPGGLLLGPRFRFGLPVSNSCLADCVAFRVARFPFPFDFEPAFCTFLCKEAGEVVNAPWR